MVAQPSLLSPPWIDADRVEEIAKRAEEVLDGLLGPAEARPSTGPSIYHALVEHRDRYANHGDVRALAPHPALNAQLGRMVSILQGEGFGPNEASFGTAVDRAMARRVDGCPTLARRATELRQIAKDAEAEMERHFSTRWIERLSDATWSASRGGSLFELMSDFPYRDGYLELVQAEAKLLNDPQRIVFGGGGPLPISGLLLASITGAEVVLVDSDAEAAQRSSRLIRGLEARGLMAFGQVEVRHGELAEIPLTEPCSGIVVASLVDTDAKLKLAHRLVASSGPRPPLVLRSAIGMCGRIAYHAIPRDAVIATGLTYGGELVPSNHVVSDLDPLTAQRFDVRTDRSETLLGVVSSSVLNSTELYLSAPGPT